MVKSDLARKGECSARREEWAGSSLGVQVRGEALGGPLGGPIRQIQETREKMA